MKIERNEFQTRVRVGRFWLERFPANPGFGFWKGAGWFGFCAFRVGINVGRGQ